MLNKGACLVTVLAASLLGAGCGTVPAPYIPKQVGQVQGGDLTQGLALMIAPQKDNTTIGEPIVFDIQLRNSSDMPLWVSKDPLINFHFTYANGHRDNYLDDAIEDRFYGNDDVVLLKPGEELERQFKVKTYYFEKSGITEFYAVLHVARNTNPAINPCWHGRLESNSYGVLVEPANHGLGELLFGQARQRNAPSS